MRPIPSFEEYVASLGHLSVHVDPTAATPESAAVKDAAASMTALEELTVESLATWVSAHPEWVPALGLTVGLGQERLKNTLRHAFDTSGWVSFGPQPSRRARHPARPGRPLGPAARGAAGPGVRLR